jgi:transketolase
VSNTLTNISQHIRRDIISSIYHARSGHPGGSLSCADILTLLFHKVLSTPNGDTSFKPDYFILSKGHAAPALYASAASIGWLKPSELKNLRKLDSKLQGHPDVAQLPWANVSTGSLGQGLSVALGIAKAGKLQSSRARHSYCVVGDGELQEGQVWEAAMFAAHHKLNNLTVIVDYNKLQSDDFNESICGLEPLAEKWRAFGWLCHEVDGHNFDELDTALSQSHNEKPKVIIAHTVKGKGVSFMENSPSWHGSVALTDEQARSALEALDCEQNEIEERLRV